MIDKKLEDNIKKTKDFIEIWNKFHNIFSKATAENHVSENKEKEFLSVRNLANSRYEDLMDSMEVKPLKRFIISPAVYGVLALDKLSIISDERLCALDKNWNESIKFLTTMLARLENRKRRIGGFSRFAIFSKKIRRRI